MSIRTLPPLRILAALAALGFAISPGLAQQELRGTSEPPKVAKPDKPAKKVAAKPEKGGDIPAIGAPAIKSKTAKEEKPKVQRPFGELEGWSSAAEAEKKKMPPPPQDQSSTGYKKPPIGFDSGGNLGMGMSF
ncbi:MAG: hypothetical protein JOZ16_06915 [Methylobacteriaceae bacterium]|nr:hypothetical protein [Methylobacteriaceae bacterium]